MTSYLNSWESFDLNRSLCRAARNGDEAKLQACVQAGASVNVLINIGSGINPKQSPLHYASENGHINCIKYLIREKANVNRPDEFGYSPLFYARENNHIECCRELISANAVLQDHEKEPMFSAKRLEEFWNDGTSEDIDEAYLEKFKQELYNLHKEFEEADRELFSDHSDDYENYRAEFEKEIRKLCGRSSDGDDSDDEEEYKARLEKKNFLKRLYKENLELIETSKDGNCLFEAVADQISNRYSSKKLREMTVMNLKENPRNEGVSMGSFLEGEIWDDYLNRMSTDEEWGDQFCLIALSRLLEKPIRILSSRGKLYDTIINPNSSRSQPILLGHIFEIHYVSLKQKTNIIEA